MKMKYTLGPWKFALGDTNNRSNGIVRSKDGTLITLRATMNVEDEATMRLIAAAPDLLEALKALVADLKPYMGQGRMDDKIRNAIAAIAKATGG